MFSLFFLLLTAAISFWAFNDSRILNELLLYPRVINGNPRQFYRFLTNGFVHADWQHLIFNMITLYFIGEYVEQYFMLMNMHFMFAVLYLAGIIVSSVPSFIKHRNNGYYRSLGASGGTSTVMFAMVYVSPWTKITFFFLPMWSILFAVLYVAYSVFAAKRGQDNINHEAHLWGGVFGFVFTFLTDPWHGAMFLQQITNPPI